MNQSCSQEKQYKIRKQATYSPQARYARQDTTTSRSKNQAIISDPYMMQTQANTLSKQYYNNNSEILFQDEVDQPYQAKESETKSIQFNQSTEEDIFIPKKTFTRQSIHRQHQFKTPLQFDKFSPLFCQKGQLFKLSKKGTYKLWDVDLRDQKLILTDGNKNRYINFNQVKAKASLSREEIIISISLQNNTEHKLVFKNSGTLTLKDWFKALNYQINSSNGINLQNSPIAIRPRFWKEQYISVKEFEKSADCLDIILFKSEIFLANLQRMMTNSQYDHVAMILRSSSEEIYLFEANSDDVFYSHLSFQGVALTQWSQFIQYKWFQNHGKIAFRKIETDRSFEVIQKLQAFVKQSYGKKFAFSLLKLLKKKSIANGHQQKDRTYFCSELIAAALKSVNLLPSERACTQYWPSKLKIK